MKEYFDKIIDLIKENKLTTLYIILGVLLVFLVLVTIFIAIGAGKQENITYDKSDFVHKILKKDYCNRLQIMTLITIGLFIAGVVLFFVKSIVAAFVVLCVYVVAKVYKILIKTDEKFNRIEYNMHEIQKYAFMSKPKTLKWSELDKVLATGIGKSRALVFIGKNNFKIKVKLNVTGGYEFMTFAEKQLEGKKFEAIKIAKARQ